MLSCFAEEGLPVSRSSGTKSRVGGEPPKGAFFQIVKS